MALNTIPGNTGVKFLAFSVTQDAATGANKSSVTFNEVYNLVKSGTFPVLVKEHDEGHFLFASLSYLTLGDNGAPNTIRFEGGFATTIYNNPENIGFDVAEA